MTDPRTADLAATVDPFTVDPATALADLVTARPARAAIFDRLGLDYCCGGQRTLRAAVADAGLDLASVTSQLTAQPAAGDSPDWASLPPHALVDHLEATHHRYLTDALARLDEVGQRVLDVHGARHPELATVVRTFRELRADLEPHLRKEELVLFPMVRALAGATAPLQFHCGTLANPISVMCVEHDRAGELLAELRAATDGFVVPADGCASYRALYDGLAELEADTHLHVHKENNVLFPAVLAAEASLAAR